MTLSIRKFALECRTPAGADPARAGDVLDRTLTGVRRDLPHLLRRALGPEADKVGIVFIDRLAFDAVISTDWSQEAIADEIGRQVLRSLWAGLSNPETLRFADNAELRARFLLDVADGAGFTRDWHRLFVGLKLLPASAIVRTLIEDDAPAALAGLACLSPANTNKIIALMNTMDADRALSAIASCSASPCRDILEIARALVAAGWAHLRQSATDTRQDQPFLLRRNAAHQIAVAAALFRANGAGADKITQRLADVLLVLTHAPLEEVLHQLEECQQADKQEKQQVIALLRASGNLDEALKSLGRATAEYDGKVYARHGGVWLLLPYVMERTDDPDLTLAALALTAGAQAHEVWRDPSLHNALGLSPADTGIVSRPKSGRDEGVADGPRRPFGLRRRDLGHLHAAAAIIGISKASLRQAMRLATHCLRRYANRLPGFSESSFAHLWTNLLSTPAMVRSSPSGFYVDLSPPPLDVIWRISGADAANYRLPDGRRVIVEVHR